VDTIAYFSFQVLIPLKPLGFQTAANPGFESVVGDLGVFGFQPVNDHSNFRFFQQGVHFLKIHGFHFLVFWKRSKTMDAPPQTSPAIIHHITTMILRRCTQGGWRRKKSLPSRPRGE
jgi:hypothetical protein